MNPADATPGPRRTVPLPVGGLGRAADALRASRPTSAHAVEPQPPHAIDLMNCPATTLAVGASVGEAARMLLNTGRTTIAVVDSDGYLVHLVTEDSVAKAYLAYIWAETVDSRDGGSAADPCWAALDFTLPPNAVELNAPLGEIIEILLGSGLHSLPVVLHGRPVGVISWHDIPSRRLRAVRSVAGP